jgi:hypothetical protein
VIRGRLQQARLWAQNRIGSRRSRLLLSGLVLWLLSVVGMLLDPTGTFGPNYLLLAIGLVLIIWARVTRS